MADFQNSLIGVPYDYTVAGATLPTGPSVSAANLVNDEPGLVFEAPFPPSDGPRGNVDIVVDLGYARSVDFVCVLGIPDSAAGQALFQVYGCNDTSFSPQEYTSDLVRAYFSGGRSTALCKAYIKFPPHPNRYWLIRFFGTPGVNFSAWRLLIGHSIQPEEGIQIGAEEGVDDRSTRRYARNGRRVIDPTLIVPTFQGEWPWLSDEEYVAIRKWWRNHGATKPSLLVLDPQQDSGSAHGGEDGILYGDFEKSSRLSYNDGTYGFSFAMVAIAP